MTSCVSGGDVAVIILYNNYLKNDIFRLEKRRFVPINVFWHHGVPILLPCCLDIGSRVQETSLNFKGEILLLGFIGDSRL